MVHKRYIKRGKKLHGPYYYESYRDEEGKTRKRYLGKGKSEKFLNLTQKRILFLYLFLGLLIVSLFLFPSFQERITGEVVYNTPISDIGSVGVDFAGGVTFDPRDNSYWVTDYSDHYVYHFDSSGDNLTDGFPVVEGSHVPNGIAFDSRDNSFWVVDYWNDFVYHYNGLGDNLMDGFSISDLYGDVDPIGITFDTRDNTLWITDEYNWAIYHINSLGENLTGDIYVGDFSRNPWGIAFDSRDNSFWVVDNALNFIFHVNSLGDNLIDGFNSSLNSPIGLTFGINNTFLVADVTGDSIYHLDYIGPSLGVEE